MPGTLQDVYVGDIFDAPLASQHGVFGTFSTNTGDGSIQWVALPAWTQLLQVRTVVNQDRTIAHYVVSPQHLQTTCTG